MKVRAPGKLVLSGAYAVLRGAPALVTAVDRCVFVDTEERSSFETPEVAAAFDLLGLSGEAHPSFDTSALREGGNKLGLGSSAAILAASLFERFAERGQLTADELERLYLLARRAHQKAQGGGSGIDVAASVYGGTLLARIREDRLELTQVELPSELVWEVWGMNHPASTSEFVRRAFELERSAPELFHESLGAQVNAAEGAARALLDADTPAFLRALRAQQEALTAWGDRAGVPIVLPCVRELHALCPSSACFLPSGAGGGDVTLYVGPEPSSSPFREAAQTRGLALVSLSLHAIGVNALS